MTAAAAAVAETSGLSTPPPPPGPRSKKLTPLFLLLPAALAMLVFFVIPIMTLASTSLMQGSLSTGFRQTFRWSNYGEILSEYYPQFLRSLLYASLATLMTLLIAYPLAYMIAFKAGRLRAVLLVLVIAPFFTSFLVRTIAWKQILADDGAIVHFMNNTGLMWLFDHLGLTEGRVLSTPFGVILGLTYNFLPFMVLPLYASLEKIDRSLLMASGDLYANSWTSFWKITWPLSLPGVVSGTLMTFIPAAGDYVNAELLGGPSTTMAGNVVNNQVRNFQYPASAAMSVVLMLAIVLLVAFYVKRSGTEELV
ncbi:ABC transporter permease [Nakamurella antarctica]|uniref:ABC transporter permease n=1 Tax=Nakamurella antarctica TaxID=1902245 RepID=A0A3G8ZIL2_9ACTN|nr:ABC transporter permease [Nakamurella antarctica]AZI57050.1 ABC transporter permease [Nakamurella antarctica]